MRVTQRERMKVQKKGNKEQGNKNVRAKARNSNGMVIMIIKPDSKLPRSPEGQGREDRRDGLGRRIHPSQAGGRKRQCRN